MSVLYFVSSVEVLDPKHYISSLPSYQADKFKPIGEIPVFTPDGMRVTNCNANGLAAAFPDPVWVEVEAEIVLYVRSCVGNEI